MGMNMTIRQQKKSGVITAANAKPQYDIIHEAWQSRAVIRYEIAVPRQSVRARANQCLWQGRGGNCHFSHNSRRIDVDINLDNQADDHRLSCPDPTPFNTDVVLADTQFGSNAPSERCVQ